jgi:hypothetical protein
MSNYTQNDWIRAKDLFEHSTPSSKDVALEIANVRIPLEARIKELEQSMQAISSLECLDFEHDGHVAGIDTQGCYQLGSDGVRHDAPPRYVLLVAKRQLEAFRNLLLESCSDGFND